MAASLINLEIEDQVAVVTNNRPEKHNAANDVQRTWQEESMAMTAIYETADYAEMKAARSQGREPRYRGR
ncbi:MAG: hypothetical protein V3T64_15990 [Myxococcota bacterium]